MTISAGSGWKPTLRGTRVPTEIEKLTLVTGRTFWLLITVMILVRCSAVSLPSAPYALAKPVTAISAAIATDILKRLLMDYLLVIALPTADRQTVRPWATA